jgi:hypothetical protein
LRNAEKPHAAGAAFAQALYARFKCFQLKILDLDIRFHEACREAADNRLLGYCDLKEDLEACSFIEKSAEQRGAFLPRCCIFPTSCLTWSRQRPDKFGHICRMRPIFPPSHGAVHGAENAVATCNWCYHGNLDADWFGGETKKRRKNNMDVIRVCVMALLQV